MSRFGTHAERVARGIAWLEVCGPDHGLDIDRVSTGWLNIRNTDGCVLARAGGDSYWSAERKIRDCEIHNAMPGTAPTCNVSDLHGHIQWLGFDIDQSVSWSDESAKAEGDALNEAWVDALTARRYDRCMAADAAGL